MITLTLTEFLIYFTWACTGQLFAIALQQVKHTETIKTYGGFNLARWICDNGWRVILTTIAMVIGVVFTEPVLNVTLNELTAFFAGMGTDKIIDSLVNKKKA